MSPADLAAARLWVRSDETREEPPEWGTDELMRSHEELLAAHDFMRSRVRPELEDIERMGVTLAHCEAWMLSHGWASTPGDPMRGPCDEHAHSIQDLVPGYAHLLDVTFGVAKHHGMGHWELLDELAAIETWMGLLQIAARWAEGSAQRVFKLMQFLGIDDASKHRRTDDDGVLWYSPEAVALLERELKSRGHSRVKA